MNIWLINHYAVPPKFYPLARTTNFAKYLMRMGHTVTIFAASSVHNSDVNLITDGSLYREDTVNGIHYVYVRCRQYSGNGAQRIINMFEFPRRLKRVCAKFPKPDAVLASSATPPACMAGLKIAKKYGAKAVGEATDLWPQDFVGFGMISPRNPALIPMYAYEKRMYETADAMVFSMEGAYDYIVEKGWEKAFPRSKFHYINNGVDLELFDDNRERHVADDPDLDDPDTFKVIYTGSIRHVNNLGLLLDAAKLVENPRVRFLVWGTGDELEALRRRVADEGIANVSFKGYVDKSYIPSIVSRADLNYVHFMPSPVFRYGVSPNKMFDYLAAGKPILSDFQCPYNPADEAGAGVTVKESTAVCIAAEVDRFAGLDASDYGAMCRKAREAAHEYDFAVLTRRLLDIFNSV